MSLDVEALLQPVSDEEPAGPDLSYDPDFRRISRELDSVTEKERPGDDPVCGPAADTAVALLERSKDMWIASHGFCFALYSGDLPRCVGLMDVLTGLAERFWDTCHPVLEEGSDPAGGRREACRQIASIGRVVKHIERAYLAPLKSKGRIAFKDIAGSADPNTKSAQLLAQAPEQIRQAIDDTPIEPWQTLAEQMGGLLEASTRLAAIFSDKVPGQGPDMTPFDQTVKRIRDFADAVVRRKAPPESPAEGDYAGDESQGYDQGAGASGGGGRSFSGPIATREQALAQLDAIKAFFQATEPSSPLPMLIDRAKRLAAMDFLQILQNLAPTGVEEANRVLDHNRDGGAGGEGGYDSSSYGSSDSE